MKRRLATADFGFLGIEIENNFYRYYNSLLTDIKSMARLERKPAFNLREPYRARAHERLIDGCA